MTRPGSVSAPASGPVNLRDVGGLPTEGGRLTREGVLYRSEVPLAGDVPPDGVVWPPRCVVDLRSREEQAQVPGLVSAAVAHRLPLFGADPAQAGDPRRIGFEAYMTRQYEAMIAGGGTLIAQLLAIVAAAEAPVLVHCTVGRDRTGVAVAVLLRVAGVTREAVMADYVVTGANQAVLFPRLAAHGIWPNEAATPEAAAWFGDTAGAMRRALDLLDEHPGGTRGWLTAHGAEDSAIDAWTERVIAQHAPSGRAGCGGDVLP